MLSRGAELLLAPGRGATFSTRVVSGLVALTDGLIVVAAGMAVYVVYVGWSPGNLPVDVLATTLNLVLTLGVFYFTGLYDFDTITAPYRQIHKILVICGVVFLLLVVMAFALKVSAQFSRVWSFSSFVLETTLICVMRTYFHFTIKKLARAGRLVRRIAIVGAGDQGKRLADELEKQKEKNPWLHVIGIYDDRTERSPAQLGDYPLIGNLDGLLRQARENRIDDILVALPWAAEDRLMAILQKLRVLPVHIHLSPDMIGLRFPHRVYNRIGDITCLSVHEKPISDWNYLLKAAEDLVLASLILVLILPLLAFIAAAIKLDSRGPVLFRQKRYGFNNELFDVYKFRTMHHGRPPEKGVPQAKRDDPRVTRVGGFLRRTSLDELPQVFNVLGGSMSLVGPRPHAVAHNEEYALIIAGYFARHRVKPGITGWAQVNGLRGETDTAEKMKARVEHDVYYIENWSFFLDLRILAMTVFVVLGQETAY